MPESLSYFLILFELFSEEMENVIQGGYYWLCLQRSKLNAEGGDEQMATVIVVAPAYYRVFQKDEPNMLQLHKSLQMVS